MSVDDSKEKKIDLNKHITQTQLVKLLNKKFKFKNFLSTDKKQDVPMKFNCQDVQGYTTRGRLPIKYGGNQIKKVYISGIPLLEVTNLQELKRETKNKVNNE